ncbi:MAG: type I-E CRISPR-associated protein Cse2/CasB [Proteobacteria bacterium]|nr:type I-E CRISPR-associated protein Cse2/CasB [Pseudomonadota bacterium]MBU1450511.1 type I-E CRISPR-associated protein Cse2/CasB [Pseudomonadota bacterium]MBU2469576.1 type I-E CRISPR-associated protein Cse2/CasB [Pseudomonadota bacterium]MBU2517156.1 type I-E CRISPR-associated protein Cse2/CasB [Pseudomonadota bacterium]
MNRKPYVSFSKPEQPDSAALTDWWKTLEDNPGGRACLRRSRSPDEAALCPSYHNLLRQLRAAGYAVGPRQAQKLAAVAGLAAHLKQRDPKTPLPKLPLAKQMATPAKEQDKSRVSGLRFRRLLEKQEAEDLYLPLMRVVKMLDGNCNLFDLARSVFWWNDRTRRQWASQYYETAPNED